MIREMIVKNRSYRRFFQNHVIETSLLEDLIYKYLPENEYHNLIKECKYIVLPYKRDDRFGSSGVFYDAVFHIKPLIVRSTPFFKKVVKDNDIGYVYNNSLEEVVEKLYNNKKYEKLMDNLVEYMNKNHRKNLKNLAKFFSVTRDEINDITSQSIQGELFK